MRIEAYNQVAQVYGTHKSAGTAKTAKTAVGYDEVQISAMGRDYQNSARYEVSTEDFACRLWEKYQLTM